MSSAFDQIAQATERLHSHASSSTLTISVLPSFAAKWLVPRLGRFRSAHPEIDLRISPASQLVDFGRGRRRRRYPHGPRRLSRTAGRPAVRRSSVFRSAARSCGTVRRRYACRPTSPRTPSFAATSPMPGVFGLGKRRRCRNRGERGPIFDDSSMLVQAAIDGQGVALARHSLVEADLAAGRLVKPFEIALPHDLAYYLVCPEAVAERPPIAAFRHWLQAEAERHGSVPP